jgi:excisionase family DNA binding protein
MDNQLLTVKELSSILQVHPKTVYRWTKNRQIRHLKKGGILRFKNKDIDDWIEAGQSNIAPSFENLPKLDLSLENYDRMLLKGRSALSKKSRRWNYGFGSVYVRKTKQGKDRWYIDYRDETGKRVQKVVQHAQQREDAIIDLQAKIAQIFTKDHPNQSKIKSVKFSNFVEMYIKNYAKVNKRSWKDDEYRLQKIVDFLGDIYLHDATALDVEKFKSHKLTDDVTKSTINRYLTVLKRMFNVAIEWGYAKGNPVNRVKFFPEKDNLKERILTSEEEDRLLEAASAHLRPILTIALHTGMRRGEILNLTWNQVDLAAREIKVEKTKSGKTRIVDINSFLLKELLRLKNTKSSSGYLFLNPGTGEPYKKLQTSFCGAGKSVKKQWSFCVNLR